MIPDQGDQLPFLNWKYMEMQREYEGWNFNSGNYLFTTDTK